MAHKLYYGDNEACVKNIHGHSYKVDWFMAEPSLTSDGMVSDFSTVKAIARKVSERYDHALALCVDDPIASNIPTQPRFIRMKENPTAENFARRLFHEAKEEGLINLARVRVWETQDCYAEYEDVDVTVAAAGFFPTRKR